MDEQSQESQNYDRERQRLVFEIAVDTRKLEIELYWKRAAYFWTLLVATFAGYFAIATASSGPKPTHQFLISCLGLVLSVGWYLVNRGSKFWQVYWERQVDSLEDEVLGRPLFKSAGIGSELKWRHFWGGYRYSVSKVNQLISLFVALVWLGLAIASWPGLSWPPSRTDIGVGGILVLTVLFIGFFFTLGLGGSRRSRKGGRGGSGGIGGGSGGIGDSSRTSEKDKRKQIGTEPNKGAR